MALKSKLFKGDPKFEACLVSDPAHITPGSQGPHVGKIQFALTVMGLGVISADEITQQRYGPSTANAVLQFKRARNIVAVNRQTTADNIVGKMTIDRLDDLMDKFEKANPDPVPPPPGQLPGPPVPPVPAEPLARKFGMRAAGFDPTGFFSEEPAEDDPTTINRNSPPNCFQIFDIDNMPRIQFDDKHVATFLFVAPANLDVIVGPNHYKRFPRIFNLTIPRPLSALECNCTYRTITRVPFSVESFMDLHFAERTVSVPMFIHMTAQIIKGTEAVTVSTSGRLKFVRLGF